MIQAVLHFDGDSYDSNRDRSRLSLQLERVRTILGDGGWHTLPELEERLGHPQASISARLRDLRKPKHGSNDIQREYVANGLWRYRMVRP